MKKIKSNNKIKAQKGRMFFSIVLMFLFVFGGVFGLYENKNSQINLSIFSLNISFGIGEAWADQTLEETLAKIENNNKVQEDKFINTTLDIFDWTVSFFKGLAGGGKNILVKSYQTIFTKEIKNDDDVKVGVLGEEDFGVTLSTNNNFSLAQGSQLRVDTNEVGVGSLDLSKTQLLISNGSSCVLADLISSDHSLVINNENGAIDIVSSLGAKVDISGETNLKAGSGLRLEGDSLRVASSIARDSELHDALTLSGGADYITLAGQEIVRNLIDLDSHVTGVLPIASGGLGVSDGSPIFNNLSLSGIFSILESGIDPNYFTTFRGADQNENIIYTLPSGAPAGNNYVLMAQTDGTMSWSSVSGTGGVSGIGTAGQVAYWSDANTITGENYLSVSRGGTGVNGSAVTDGQILIGNDGANNFSLSSLTQGSGIIITNGAGTITLASALGTAIDISDETNLAGNGEIILTGDSLSIASSIARDSELHSAVTLSGQNYLSLVGQAITASQINLTSNVSGTLPIASGGTGATTLDNLITLGTHTIGNYINTITGSSQIAVGGVSAENATATLSIVNDSIGDTQLAFDTGQHLTVTSSPTFAGLTLGGMTTGSIIFQGASGLTQDNGNLFWDDTNNRLGIGTTIPADLLVVSKTVGANTGQVRFGGVNGRTLSAYNNGVLSNFDFSAVETFFNSDFVLASGKEIEMYNYTGTDSSYAKIYVPSDDKFKIDVNGADRMVIDSAGNVGIGTTSPYTKLAVAQTEDNNGIRLYGYDDKVTSYFDISINGGGSTVLSAVNGGLFYNSDVALFDNRYTTYGANQQTYSQGYDATDGYFRFRSNYINGAYPAGSVSGDIFRVYDGTDDLIIPAGNVGIGTTNPGAKLEVNGDVRFAGVPYFGPELPNNPVTQTIVRDGSILPFNTNTALSNIEWQHNSNDGYILHLTQGVNMGSGAALIGLGIDHGGRGLYVNNKATGKGIVITQNSTITSPSAYGILINAGNGAAPGFYLQQNSTGIVNTTGAVFEAYSALDTAQKLVEFKYPSGTAGYILSQTGDLIWKTRIQTGSGSIDAPGLAFGDGDSGIYEDSDDSLDFSIAGIRRWTINGSSITAQESGGARLLAGAGSALTPTYNFAGDSDTGFYRFAINNIRFSTGGSDRLTIDASGNVGIGTTSPSAKLHLAAGIAAANGAPLKFTAGVLNTTAEAGAIEFDGTNLYFSPTNGNRKTLGYTDGSNISHGGLIGLSSDDHTQYALLNGRLNGQTLIGGTGIADILKLQGTAGDGTLTSPAIQALVGNNGATSALTILNNGNVGIGTTSPLYALDVNGTSRLNGPQIFQGNSASDSAPLGADLMIGKTASGTNWTGTDFTTGYTHTGTTGDTLTSNLNAVNNTYYQITITTTGVTGGRIENYTFGGVTDVLYISSNVTTTRAIKATSTAPFVLNTNSSTGFTGTITVSIKTVGVNTPTTQWVNSTGGIFNEMRATSATSNALFGVNAGSRMTLGNFNTAYGKNSMQNTITGNFNTAFGYTTLINNVGGQYNTAIGYNIFDGTSLPVGNLYNVGVGGNIGGPNMASSTNVFLGWNIGSALTTGGNNIAMGYNVLSADTTGVNNVAVGSYSLLNNTTGNGNVAIGLNSLYSNTTSSNNIAIGSQAGRYFTGNGSNATSNNSLYLGYNTMALADGDTNEIVIGTSATGIGSNTVTLGNDSIITTALKGNIGIGTTTPGYNLDVNGSANVSGTLTVETLTATNLSSGSAISAPYFTATSAVGTSTFAGGINISGNIIPTTDNTYSLGSATNMWKDVYIGPGSLYINGKKVIQEASESMVFSADLNQNLIVQTSGSGDIELNPLETGLIQLKGNIELTAGKTFRTSTGVPIDFSDGILADNLSLTGNILSAANTNGSLELAANGLGAVYVTTGNFGLGTTGPLEMLDVNGRVHLAQTTAPGTTTDRLYNVGGSLYWNGIDLTAGGTGASQWTTSGSDIYYNTGNVGIGTTSPGYKLDVNGNSRFTGSLTVDNNADLILPITEGWTSGGNILLTRPGASRTAVSIGRVSGGAGDDGEILLYRDGVLNTRLSSSADSYFNFGNVGIGTTSPGAKLHVSGGEITLDNNYYYKVKDTGGVSRGIFTINSSNNTVVQSPLGSDRIYLSSSDNMLSFVTNNIERFRVSNQGNVGIGTTSPTAQLHLVKADSSALTDILVNPTVKTSGDLIDLQVGGVSKFKVNNTGSATFGSTLIVNGGIANYGNRITGGGGLFTIDAGGGANSGGGGLWINQVGGAFTHTSGNIFGLKLSPSYNQVSSTAANTDLLINRTEISIGSGVQYLMDAQVGGASKFNVSNTGNGYFAGNVGIGTTSPTYKLQVESAGSDLFRMVNTTTGGYTNWQIGNDLMVTNSGSMLFSNSTSFAINNGGSRAVTVTGGNVGIGTASPEYKLDIRNTLNVGYQNETAGTLSIQRGGGYTAAFIMDGSIGVIKGAGGYTFWQPYNYANADNTFVAAHATVGGFSWRTGAVSGEPTSLPEIMRLERSGELKIGSNILLNPNGNNSYINSGNVGIGTTNPASLLHLYSANPVFRMEDSDGGYSTVSSNGSHLTLSADTGNSVAATRIAFEVDGAELARLVGGNLGIGTTSPTARLEIKGNGNTTSTYSIKATDSAGSLTMSVRDDGMVVASSGLSAPTLYGALRNSADWNNAQIQTNTTGTVISRLKADSSPTLVINQMSSGSTGDILDLQASGVTKVAFLQNGNVGIGTTSPQAKLHLYGDSALKGGIVMQNSAYTTDVIGGIIATQETTGDFTIGQLGISELMRIKINGNVGIGTESPNSKLDVFALTTGGKIRLSSNNNSTYGEIRFSSNSVDYLAYGSSIEGTGNDIGVNVGDLRFKTGHGEIPTERMRIDSYGNVGIGTTEPSYTLDIKDSGTGLRWSGANNYFTVKDWSVSPNYGPQIVTDNDSMVFPTNIYFGSSVNYFKRESTVTRVHGDGGIKLSYWNGSATTTGLTLTTSGNVGIGTESPNYLLDVAGDINTSTGVYRLANVTTLSRSGSLVSFGPTDAGTAISLNTAGAQRMRIDSMGNIGIGTTSPNQQLEITKNFLLPSTTYNSGNPYGIIYKGSAPFIHDFSYGNNGTVTPTGNNIFIGKNSGNLTTGSTAIFTYQASNNIGIGEGALQNNTTGYINAAIGRLALSSNTIGLANMALGQEALRNNVGGNYNVATGFSALRHTINSSSNVGVGYQAGAYITGGSTANATSHDSVYLGYNTMALADGDTNEIVIGASATGVGSNSVVLGNDSITKTILKGNVGIGTVTPSHLLQVGTTLFVDNVNGRVGIGNSAPSAPLQVLIGADNGSAGIKIDGVSAGSTAHLEISNTSLTMNRATGSLTSFTIGTVASSWSGSGGSIIFKPDNSEAMRILTSGNVGIGTTSPLDKLHVSGGNIRIGNGVGDSNDRFTTYSTNYNTWSVGGSQADGLFRISGAANITDGGTKFVISGDGNVGIGTISPGYKLEVNGPIYTSGGDGLIVGTSVAGKNRFYTDAGEFRYLNSADNWGNIQVGSGYFNGNVGIGTTSPGKLLNVYSTTAESSILVERSAISGVALSIYKAGALSAGTNVQWETGLIASTNAYTIRTWDGVVNTSPFTILNSGNVGIGTTSPSYALDVRGATSTSGVNSQAGYNINLLAPPVAPTGSLAPGTNLGIGQYYYFVTYVTATGETSAGSYFAITTTSGNQAVNLNIPVSSDSRVTARKIYRTKVGATSDNEYYLATVSDNSTTSYSDTIADASLTGTGLQYYKVNTTSKYITAAGVQSMIIDNNLTAFGIGAGSAIIANSAPATRTVLIGAYAGQKITTGTANVIVGQAGGNLTTGGSNSFLGDLAGYSNVSGYSNTIMGSQAGRFLLTSNNTMIGSGAGTYLNDGTSQLASPTNSIYLGVSSRGFATDETNAIVIGHGALGLGSNTTVIGNSSTTTTALWGNVGIGTTTPGAKLDINGSTYINSGSGIRSGNILSIGLAESDTVDGSHGIIGLAVGAASYWNIRQNTGHALSFDSYNGSWGSRVTLSQNGNVGIGTTSPVAKLQIKGNLFIEDDETTLYSRFDTSDLFGTIGTVSNIPFRLVANNEERIRIQTNGNVGIGTTSPGEKLVVDNSADADSVLQIRSSGGTLNSAILKLTTHSTDVSWLFENSRANRELIISHDDASGRNFIIKNKDAAGESMRINSSGNVGIGTTSPGDLLHIANASGESAKIALQNNEQTWKLVVGSLNEFRIDGDNSSAFLIEDSAPSDSLKIDNTGNIGIGTTSPTSRLHGVTTLSADTGNEVAYQLNYTTNKVTSGNDTGLLINMTDTASPGSSILLDLQIGGVSKGHFNNGGEWRNLNAVKSSSNTPLTIGVDGSISVPGKGQVQLGSASTFTGVSGDFHGLKIVSNYNQASGTASNTDLLITRTETAIGSGAQYLIDAQVGGVNKFNVSNIGNGYFAGNVGIGTTSPGTLLDVSANVAGSGGTYFTTAGTIQNRNATNGAVNLNIRGYSNETNVAFGRNKAGATLTFNNLDSTNGNYSLFQFNNASDFGYAGFVGIAKTQGGTGVAEGELGFNVRNTTNNMFEAMRIASSGNVGIGTTSPSQMLDVNGNITINNNKLYLLSTTSYLDRTDLKLNNAGIARISNIATDGDLYLTTTGAGDVIVNNGNVGIGTTSPVAPLQVTGANGVMLQVGNNITFGNNAGGSGSSEIQSLTTSIDFLGKSDNTGSFNFYGGGAYNSGAGIGIRGSAKATLPNTISFYNGAFVERIRMSATGGLSLGSGYVATDPGAGSMIISGNVGIGTTGPLSKLSVGGAGNASYQAYVQGTGNTSATYGLVVADSGATNNFYIQDDGAGYLRAASWTYGSDRRMKENIKDFDYGLETITQLNPQQFDYIDGVKNQFGFIAQEIQALIPEMVKVQQGGMLGLQTDMLLPIMVKAIQQQQAQITGISNSQLSISNEFSNTNNQISTLILKTDANITNLSQLQTSVDGQLSIAGQNISELMEKGTDQEVRLLSLESDKLEQDSRISNLEIALQEQIVKLEEMSNQELNFAWADLFASILDIDETNGDVNILNIKNFSAEITETGLLVIKVINNDAPTIGTAVICPAMKELNEEGKCEISQIDEDSDSIDDNTGNVISNGKKIAVKTQAVKNSSKVFVTIKSKLTKEATLMVTDINENESFDVELVNPTEEDVTFDWWIVEMK